MTKQKREYIIDALSEIKDLYIAEAAEYEKSKVMWKYWREFGAVAACVVTVAVTAAAWKFLPIGQFAVQENASVEESVVDMEGDIRPESTVEGIEEFEKSNEMMTQEGVSAEGAFEEIDQPIEEITEDRTKESEDIVYSKGIEAEVIYEETENKKSQVDQLIGEPEGSIENCWEEPQELVIQGSASIAEWIPAEDIFAKGWDIFQGTVTEKKIYQVSGDMNTFFTVVTVEVEECIRGELSVGEEYTIYLPVAAGQDMTVTNSICGELVKLAIGSKAIFMPPIVTEESGEGRGNAWLSYADFADYYCASDATVFLETTDGVSYVEEVYEISEEGSITLEDVKTYIKDMIAKQ